MLTRALLGRLGRLQPAELAGLAVLAAALTPPDLLAGGPTLCPFRRLTGRPCPACGMSRSWSSLAHLRARDAVRYHPLGPATFIGAAWVALESRRGRTPAVLTSTPVVGGLIAVWLAVWLRRLVS